jgi:hypothetical protein
MADMKRLDHCGVAAALALSPGIAGGRRIPPQRDAQRRGRGIPERAKRGRLLRPAAPVERAVVFPDASPQTRKYYLSNIFPFISKDIAHFVSQLFLRKFNKLKKS